MSRSLPPLNPLHVFEVVARTQNLTLAAQELRVTQSAVSRQVATLEAYLGVGLFRRERHGVTLTQVGRAYAEKVVPAFEQIGDATDALLRSTRQGVLRVRTYTTFTAKWLIPRLPAFREKHPDIEVVISNGVPDVDFDRDPVDVAIQFGDGKWPRVQLDLLFGDEIEPVCSPAFLQQHLGAGEAPATLLKQRLLESRYRSADWGDWLAATGLAPAAEQSERMRFSTSVLTWQAALDGLGIAIGQLTMLESEFRQGTLVRPFARPLRRERGHYLVRPAEQRYSQKVNAFRHWIMGMAQGGLG